MSSDLSTSSFALLSIVCEGSFVACSCSELCIGVSSVAVAVWAVSL